MWKRFSIEHWRWAIALIKFEDHWSFQFFCLWIRLWSSRTSPKGDMLDKWGWEYDRDHSHLCLSWRDRRKYINMPWAWDHCQVEVMLRNGIFVPYDRFRTQREDPKIAEIPEPVNRYRETFSYHYILRSGVIQVRTATVTVERRTWKWRWFKWLPWPRMVRTSICVEFSDEVGEETGSWKGGCIGCGWDLKRGETPEQCLRRMEAERKF